MLRTVDVYRIHEKERDVYIIYTYRLFVDIFIHFIGFIPKFIMHFMEI